MLEHTYNRVDRNKLRHRCLRKNQGCTSGIRHGQGQLEIKLATGQPFDSEHGTGANRTAQMGCCVSIAWAVRAEQIAAA